MYTNLIHIYEYKNIITKKLKLKIKNNNNNNKNTLHWTITRIRHVLPPMEMGQARTWNKKKLKAQSI